MAGLEAPVDGLAASSAKFSRLHLISDRDILMFCFLGPVQGKRENGENPLQPPLL